VERPVRAVDLFIASLDALTLLRGSSTLSARIDSDERATLLAAFGWPVCGTNGEAKGRRERKNREERRSRSDRADAKKKRSLRETSKDLAEERRNGGGVERSADSSNISRGPDESLWDRKEIVERSRKKKSESSESFSLTLRAARQREATGDVSARFLIAAFSASIVSFALRAPLRDQRERIGSARVYREWISDRKTTKLKGDYARLREEALDKGERAKRRDGKRKSRRY